MAFKKVSRVEVTEIIRRWQANNSLRGLARSTGLSRKTVRKNIQAAETCSLTRDGPPSSETQLLALVPLNVAGPRQVVRPRKDLLEPRALRFRGHQRRPKMSHFRRLNLFHPVRTDCRHHLNAPLLLGVNSKVFPAVRSQPVGDSAPSPDQHTLAIDRSSRRFAPSGNDGAGDPGWPRLLRHPRRSSPTGGNRFYTFNCDYSSHGSGAGQGIEDTSCLP